MRPSVRDAVGGTLLALGLATMLAAAASLQRLTPLPERADIPSGFGLVFLLLLSVVGLGLITAGVSLLGSGADWVGPRARATFRAAGYLVAVSLPVAVLSVPLTGRIEAAALVVVGAALLGTLVALLGLAVGAASVARRAVARRDRRT